MEVIVCCDYVPVPVTTTAGITAKIILSNLSSFSVGVSDGRTSKLFLDGAKTNELLTRGRTTRNGNPGSLSDYNN